MTLVSSDDDLDWEFALIRTLGIRPVLGGANGEEIEETVRGIAYLVPGGSRNRCRLERVVLLQSALIVIPMERSTDTAPR